MVNNTVSVIIPVYNEEKYIHKCVMSLIEQSYENVIEILVVDGGSSDETLNILEDLKFEFPKLAILKNERKIQPAALNIGITAAKGEIIIRADAHAMYDKDYILKSVEKLNKLKKDNVVNVGGPTYLVTSDNYIENSIVYLHESKFGIGVAKFRQKDYEGFVDTVWNGSFWKSVFDEVGLYNENLYRSEDNDMNNRIIEKGYKIYQSKDIIAYYKPRTTVKQVLGQNFGNGKAIGDSIINNKSIVRIRHLVPLGFLLSIILFGATWSMFYISRIMETAILGSYFFIDLIESLKIGRKNGIKYTPIMIVLFFILHIAYGAGTVLGFFKGIGHSNK